MHVQERNVVEREVRIEATPETRVPFFTDPDKMIRWKGSTAELDPRPGGIYRVAINEQAIARGKAAGFPLSPEDVVEVQAIA